MVLALNRVTAMDPKMQRREPVRASVTDGSHSSAGVSKEKDRFFQQYPFEQTVGLDFIIPRCHIPSIFQGAHDAEIIGQIDDDEAIRKVEQ